MKTKNRDLVDAGWRAEATSRRWTNEELDAAIRERVDELQAIRAGNGGSFESLSEEQVADVRRLTGELEVLQEEVIDPDHQHPGHRASCGGRHGESIVGRGVRDPRLRGAHAELPRRAGGPRASHSATDASSAGTAAGISSPRSLDPRGGETSGRRNRDPFAE